MRTFLVLMLMVTFGPLWSQQIASKKITIELTHITLEEAFTILSISYGVEFYYSDDVVPTAKIINLSVHEEDLKVVLDKICSMANLGYKITGNRVLIKKSSQVLSQTIRGFVRDEITNTSIPGASVLIIVNGQQHGTSTDSLGRFK